MISDELFALLRCPETHQPLTTAPADVIAQLEAERLAGRLRDRAGNVLSEPVEAGLLRADGALFFPIRGGIPVLLAAEAVALPLV